MEKEKWKFAYKALQLAEGARKKKESAEEKFKWWEAKKEELMKKVPEGLKVQESVASTYSNVKSGYGPQVVIDQSLQRALSETHSRLIALDQAIREYDGWIQVLTANATQTVELDHTDWFYFFGAESQSKLKIDIADD